MLWNTELWKLDRSHSELLDAALTCNLAAHLPTCLDATGATLNTACDTDITSGFPATVGTTAIGLYHVTSNGVPAACSTDPDCAALGAQYGCAASACVVVAPNTASCQTSASSGGCFPPDATLVLQVLLSHKKTKLGAKADMSLVGSGAATCKNTCPRHRA